MPPPPEQNPGYVPADGRLPSVIRRLKYHGPISNTIFCNSSTWLAVSVKHPPGKTAMGICHQMTCQTKRNSYKFTEPPLVHQCPINHCHVGQIILHPADQGHIRTSEHRSSLTDSRKSARSCGSYILRRCRQPGSCKSLGKAIG